MAGDLVFGVQESEAYAEGGGYDSRGEEEVKGMLRRMRDWEPGTNAREELGV